VSEGQPPGESAIIPRERAERIARAHACVRCKEYSYRKVAVKPSTASLREALGEVWHALLVCGVCGTTQELGIDADGDVVYAG
jgi:transcription elongation factor Elf1